jgi:hypothetical protein
MVDFFSTNRAIKKQISREFFVTLPLGFEAAFIKKRKQSNDMIKSK